MAKSQKHKVYGRTWTPIASHFRIGTKNKGPKTKRTHPDTHKIRWVAL